MWVPQAPRSETRSPTLSDTRTTALVRNRVYDNKHSVARRAAPDANAGHAGLLLLCSMSLAVLVLGMLATLIR